MTVAIEHPQQTADRTLTIQGGWDKFRLIQSAFDETQGIRLFYFDGEIEILMPSKLHEIFSHVLGVLLTNFVTTQAPHLDLQIPKTLLAVSPLFICSIEKLPILNKVPILESS